jgi:NAD-dependent dihydropyrimidine dehydrogenase PreA subunit
MSRHRLTVVLSQAQGKNPTKRALEESIVAALILEPGLEVSIVPYLYDLDAQHTGRLFLESITGDLVVLAWMYPRAAFWLLDRDGVRGHYGVNQIAPSSEEEEEEEGEPEAARGIGSVNVPERHVYCLDLRDHAEHRVYVDEVRRIKLECEERHETRRQARSAECPQLVQLGGLVRTTLPVEEQSASRFAPEQLLQQPARRWYPVIDYSRCTNCLECLDFCLFGVYGVDSLERILVEDQDECKKGCPACSRVCPENAIMFPDYKSPAIAGAPVGSVSGLKIDLTKLFGGGDALTLAAQERDRELVRDGRAAVGLTVGIPKRQANKAPEPRDDLDSLIDALDDLEI